MNGPLLRDADTGALGGVIQLDDGTFMSTYENFDLGQYKTAHEAARMYTIATQQGLMKAHAFLEKHYPEMMRQTVHNDPKKVYMNTSTHLAETVNEDGTKTYKRSDGIKLLTYHGFNTGYFGVTEKDGKYVVSMCDFHTKEFVDLCEYDNVADAARNSSIINAALRIEYLKDIEAQQEMDRAQQEMEEEGSGGK